MQIQVALPIEQTAIFSLILIAIILIFVKKEKKDSFFPVAITNELKGFAILAIIFSHIGYFLAADTRFLYPLSILAGVGVNLFLFLSGYGLTISLTKKKLTIKEFYKKRLVKLFLPLWLIISVFFTLDYFWLKITYPLATISQSFFGYFPKADIFQSLDSPLWYFTLILFYYLIFPLVFFKKNPGFSAGLILLISYSVLKLNLPIAQDVLKLYQLHLWAFPLGVLFAAGFFHSSFLKKLVPTSLEKILYRLGHFKLPGRIISIIILSLVVAYTAIHSGIGGKIIVEQSISLITMFCLVLIFIIKKIEFRIFSLFGIYSYEIYLIHWPILYRYDIFYKFLPAFLATLLYLILFLLLGFGLKKIQDWFNKKIHLLN